MRRLTCPFVSPAQDGDPSTLGQQPLRKKYNDGGFPGPPDRQIADADDPTGQPCGREPPLPVTPQPKSDDEAVQPGNPVQPLADRLSRLQERHVRV